MPGRNRVAPLFSSPSVSSTRDHFLSRSLQGPHLSSNPGHRFGKETSMPPDPEAADSRRELKFPYLDRSSFPILKKRESQRHPASLSDSDNVNLDEEIVTGDGGRSMTAGMPSVVGPDMEPEPEPEGGGLEEFRAKLLVHLREAADRLNLIVPPPIRTHPISGPLPLPVGTVPSSSAAEDAGHRSLGRRRRTGPGAPIPTDRHVSPPPPSEMRNRATAVIVGGVHQEPQPDSAMAPSSEPLSSAVGLWNLRRRRRGPSRAPIPVERHVSLSPVAVRSSTRARREMERPLFSITLTREEIAEDIYAVTGSLPRRRPTKRPRAVQRQLDSLLPGSWLSEVTADTYKVRN